MLNIFQVLPSTSQQATGVGQQRVLLQAHSSSTQLRTIAPNLGNLPPGATIQFPPGTIFKDGVVYVPQVSIFFIPIGRYLSITGLLKHRLQPIGLPVVKDAQLQLSR